MSTFMRSFACISFSSAARAEVEDLSLSDILNLQLVTASKKSEDLFDSPLSASVVTREEIRAAGAMTIPEAMRLFPGMIVREQTNGNFEVVQRGIDNLPYKDAYSTNANSTMLVMIDNRVVYSYFQGGTFWETLPIGLDDIEQIEVVRGPSSALYGPNAMVGVVNIISRKAKKEGFSTWGSATTGNGRSRDLNASVSYLVKDKWRATFNFNNEEFGTKSNQYYDFYQKKYVAGPDQILFFGKTAFNNTNERYPDPQSALHRLGVNSFLNYQLSDHVTFDLQAGYQNSRAQLIYFDIISTPITTRDSSTYYVDLKNKWVNLDTHLSFLAGDQGGTGIRNYNVTNTIYQPGTGPLGVVPQINFPYFVGAPVYGDQVEYDFQGKLKIFDGTMENDFNSGPFSLKPGIEYRYISYDSLYFGGLKDLWDAAASLRSEYKWEDWRWVGSLRVDKYENPKKPYASWQLAATRKLGDNHLLRAVYSRANKAPAFSELYVDLTATLPVFAASVLGQDVYRYVRPHTVGDPGLELAYMDLYELGMRSRLGSNFTLDGEFFYEQARNLPGVLPTAVPFYSYVGPRADANQVGITVSAVHSLGKTFQNRLYATVQETTRTQGDVTEKHASTPMLYGGLVSNFRPISKLNVNLNPYFYTSQTFNPAAQSAQDATVTQDVLVPSKLIFNAKVSYEVYQDTNIFLDARNLFDNRNPEYAYASEAGGLYLVGLNAAF